MKLEVLIGMIGSGKSTYARTRADEGALVICHDELTTMLHSKYRYEEKLRECYRLMEESLAWAGLDFGRDVVIDRTHLTKESRHRWILFASSYDSLQTFDGHGPTTPVVAIVFQVESPVIHADRRFRSDPRGRSYEEWLEVARHHRKQWDKEPFGEDEGFTEIKRIS